MRLPGRRPLAVDHEHVVLLKGLLLLVAVLVAFAIAWHLGLIRRVWMQDRTGLSTAITLIFVLAALAGGSHLRRLSAALNHLRKVEGHIAAHGYRLSRDATPGLSDHRLPPGVVSEYIATLERKKACGGSLPINQRLLLDSFAGELRRGHGFGWFVADLLLSLGLLGTVVGFILMLSPISHLNAGDPSAVKAMLAVMSDGMAVALYTTLTGLSGGMLLKILGLLLESTVEELVRRTTQLTEIHVLPAIERERDQLALRILEEHRHALA